MLLKIRVGLLAFFVALSAVISVADVYAKWIYLPPLDPIDTSANLFLGEFYFVPEEVLPDEEYSELHENHLNVVTLILEHATYGINTEGNKSNVIHDNLNGVDSVLYLNQKIEKGNMKFFYNFYTGQEDSSQVFFCVQKKSDTLYYVYTYSKTDLTANRVNTKERITAYLTAMQFDDDDGLWSAIYSRVGSAIVISVPNYDFFRYGIDAASWQPD